MSEVSGPTSSVSQRLSRPPAGPLGEPQHLPSLFPRGVHPSMASWWRERQRLQAAWRQLLGRPSHGSYDPRPETLDRIEDADARYTVYRQPTGPAARQLVVVAEPRHSPYSPRLGAVVPFYHPEPMLGYDPAAKTRLTERPEIQFARHLVQQGYVAVCPEAFPYNTVPEPADNAGLAWWQAAADRLLVDHPHWTGMGKLIADTSRAVDLLLAQPDIDSQRIVAIGHSLGGKMAFFAGAFDTRIKAVIASDFGIGWSFTNWSDPWYFGDRILQPGFALANHQPLAFCAPRSFLLLAGQYDGRASWQYLEAARPVYRLHGREHALGLFDHASGHSPTPEALHLAYAWLAEQFGLPYQPWSL